MAWTAPRTWVAGETVTAAMLNTHVRDNLKAIGDPWSSWTPTITAATGSITSTTVTAFFAYFGKVVLWQANVGITNAGTGAAELRFTLPVTARNVNFSIGTGRAASTGHELVIVNNTATTGSAMRYDNSTVITTGNTLQMSGCYEAA